MHETKADILLHPIRLRIIQAFMPPKRLTAQAIGAVLPIDEFVVCAHDNADHCVCRKPRPGMVLEAAARHGVDLRQSFLIGDRWRDIDCGAAAGVRTVFIERGYRERAPEHAPDFVTESLGAAVEWILQA